MKNILLTTIFIFCSAANLLAQPGFDDNVNDEPTAPIDQHLVWLALVGLGILSYYFIKSKTASKKSA